MKIFISSDHAGLNLKDYIFENLKKKNNKIINLGPFSDKSVDYPIFAKKLANKVAKNKDRFRARKPFWLKGPIKKRINYMSNEKYKCFECIW